MMGSSRKRLLIALLFLLPNLLGFIVFTAGPVLFSLGMAFTDWALTRHNQFSETSIRWIGLQNFQRVINGDESHLFWDYFGNTIFMMLGIPLGIAGSLALALMLNSSVTPQKPRARFRGTIIALILTAIAIAGVWLITTPGPIPPSGSDSALAAASAEVGLSGLTRWQVADLRSKGAMLAIAALGIIAACGIGFGQMFFRGLFYLPSLLAGVAMFLLWKTLYRPEGGLINAGLKPILDIVQSAVTSTPALLWYGLGILLLITTLAFSIWLIAVGLNRLHHRDTGIASFIGRLAIVATLAATGLGLSFVLFQLPERSLLPSGREPLAGPQLEKAVSDLALAIPTADINELRVSIAPLGDSIRATDAIAILSAAAGNTRESAREARRIVHSYTPELYEGLASRDGLSAPLWLVDARWAKIALIIMGVWAGLGGGTMLLFLAGLANIPPELYEAAGIDGATGWQRFIHVTWPQLAPTTFFIVIMSTIGGLQGGFEQAMVMTQGKADTIVLAYYIYNIAFTDQFQLGLASAIAWVMFIMIFAMTALNFRLGSQMTNE